MNARRREGRGRQRGAIGLFGALVMMLVVLVSALAIDAGRLYVEQRRLQIIADQAAINAANQTGYCGYNGLVGLDQLKTAAQASAANHGYTGNLAGEEGAVLLGIADATNGVRSFTPTVPADADSVYVKARKSVPASLMAGGLFGFGGAVNLQAEAAARRPVRATISAGSYLAEVDLNESILNPLLGGLLGSSVALQLLHYQGLLGAQVSLLQLLQAAPVAGIDLGVGTVDELLEADISVLQLLDLLATVADEQNLAAVQLALAALPLPSIETGGLQLKLADVLSLGVADGQQAVNAKVNVLDILTTGLQVANKDHFIALNTGVTLPGLTPGGIVNVGLTIIEPPQIAVGRPGLVPNGDPNDWDDWRTAAHTAQVRLQVAVPLQLDLGILRAKVDLAVLLEVASADAGLDSLNCGTYPDFRQQVRLQASSALLALGIGAIQPSSPPPDIEDIAPATVSVEALGIPVATVLVGATPYAGSSENTPLDYNVTLAELQQGPVVQEASASVGDSLATALESLDLELDVSLLGLPPLLELLGVSGLIEGLLDLLIPNLLRPLLDVLDDVLLDPLLSALGIQVGGVAAALVDVDLAEAQLVY